MNNDMTNFEEQGSVKKDRRVLKSGSYTFGITVIVIAIVIAINLVITSLPTTYTQFDMSKDSVYSIGDTTTEILNALTDDVTIYYICEEGSENVNIEKMLQSYNDMFDKVTVNNIDPAVNPNFTTEYTTESLSNNSLIVVSEKRNTVVKSGDMFRYSVEGYTEMSSSEMSSFATQYYYSYGSYPDVTELFYGEQYITSAVAYVTTETIPSLYYTTGHGEDTLATAYTGYISSENYSYAELNLLTSDIPDDAEAIFMYAPTNDFTEAEAEKLLHYIKAGGDVILVSDYTTYTNEKMPNLANLCAAMGMRSVDGLVMEGDTNRYLQYPNYILPVIGSTDETSPASCLASANIYVLCVGSHAIEAIEADNVSVTTVLSTTDKAYMKTEINENTTYAIQDGDIEGQFILGAAATYTDGGHFVWYSSTAIADNSADSMIGKGNSQVFISTLNWMAEKTESISIIGKDISVTPLTVTESSATIWKAVFCFIVPATIIIVGIVVWVRRRRR